MSRTIKGGGIGVLLLALVGVFFGIDPSGLLQRNVQMQTGSSVQSTQITSSNRVILTKHLTRPA
ncbi:MAG: neutral zinc metallopeptidase [Thermodesulfobacteriota bacterium]|nr:neutral zinc metallopeptidase [Thermodesulfobacteriota bacterium]